MRRSIRIAAVALLVMLPVGCALETSDVAVEPSDAAQPEGGVPKEVVYATAGVAGVALIYVVLVGVGAAVLFNSAMSGP